MISNEQQIQDPANLRKVVEHYVKLKRRGISLVGLCPFHSEKTPSFSVQPTTGVYKCFGCGEGGSSPANFIMDMEGMDSSQYAEALARVAEICNIPVEYKRGANYAEYKEKAHAERKEREANRILLEQVLAHWHSLPEAYDFPVSQWSCDATGEESYLVDVDGRTFPVSVIDRFGVVDLRQKNSISSVLQTHNWDADRLALLGLIRRGQGSGQPYDFFNHRILFPIHDRSGKLAGFAGRIFRNAKDQKTAKYLNSPESPNYQKSELLYGLHQNKRAIRQADFAYLVEGYTDVLGMVAGGIDNTVATCGTALTPEQVANLKRYCREVRILRDGDPAGMKAAVRDVAILAAAGMKVQVIQLPKGEDPESFVRKHRREAFDIMELNCSTDGIMFAALRDFDKSDPHSAAESMERAAQLMAKIPEGVVRDGYISKLTRKGGIGATFKKPLQERVQSLINETLEKESRGRRSDELTDEQEDDLRKYGIFIESNRYYKLVKMEKVSISNCVIEPIYHVASRENPSRLVRVVNEEGHAEILNVHTDTFVELSAIKKMLASLGNFMFFGKADDLERVMRQLYKDSPSMYLISTLGHHRKGFFAWANGAMIDGEFVPGDINGMVEIEQTKFMLPGATFDSETAVNYDDDALENDYVDLFRYVGVEDGRADVHQWSQKFLSVYGDNGVMGIAFYLASNFRDLIYREFDFFPLLNFFGPPQRGKSTMAWSIQYMYGAKARQPIPLSNTTVPGAARRLTQYRNVPVWFDEYKNEIDGKLIELLKGMYDGVGRTTGTMTSTKGTKRMPVYTPAIISGQDLPTADAALLTRCITLHFNFQRTEEGDRRLKELRDLERSGILTQITGQLQKYRDLIERKFAETFERVRQRMAEKASIKGLESRVLNNHCIPLTVVELLNKEFTFATHREKPFLEALEDITVNLMATQTSTIIAEDDVAGWWNTIEYLITEKSLRDDVDFIIEEATSLSLVAKAETLNGSYTRKQHKLIKLPPGSKVMYLRFTRSHPLYQKEKVKRHEKAFPLATIKSYLRQSPSFLGYMKSKYFEDNQSRPSCYVFLMDSNFPFDRPLTDVVLATTDPAWSQRTNDPSPAPPTKKDADEASEPPF